MNSLSVQKYYRPEGIKASRVAVNAKRIKEEVGIADEMIERIR